MAINHLNLIDGDIFIQVYYRLNSSFTFPLPFTLQAYFLSRQRVVSSELASDDRTCYLWVMSLQVST